MDSGDIILIVLTLPRQDILIDVITPVAGDPSVRVIAWDVVCAWVAVDAMQVVGIDVGVRLVVVPRRLDDKCMPQGPSTWLSQGCPPGW